MLVYGDVGQSQRPYLKVNLTGLMKLDVRLALLNLSDSSIAVTADRTQKSALDKSAGTYHHRSGPTQQENSN